MLRKIVIFLESYVMPLESTLCLLLPKTFILVICINTRRTAEKRAEEGIVNVGDQVSEAPREVNQVPPFEEVYIGDQVSIVSPPMTNGEIMETFLNLDKAMTLQAKGLDSQVKSMMAQVNREV